MRAADVRDGDFRKGDVYPGGGQMSCMLCLRVSWGRTKTVGESDEIARCPWMMRHAQLFRCRAIRRDVWQRRTDVTLRDDQMIAWSQRHVVNDNENWNEM